MPKGDRELLKADPEDGTTPIANLLLEALAIARLTGKEKGAILYLCRRTYGWHINGDRLKEAKIPFLEWTKVLNTDAAHTSTLLTGLVNKKVFLRRYIGPSGPDRGYYYSLNTKVAEWSNTCINLQVLREMVNIQLPKTATKYLPKTATTLASKSCVGNKDKEILNKGNTDIEIDNKKANKLWQRALKELEGQVNKANFETWLKNTTGMRHQNNTFVVGVQNTSVAEYLERNQSSLIQRTLCRVIGKDINVRFEVSKASQAMH